MGSERGDEIRVLKEELAGRQRPEARPRRMGDIVNVLLARRGYGHVQTADDCARAWETAAGAELAKHTRAGGMRRGVLEVIVRSSAVLQELSFEKRRLVARLAQLLPLRRIRDVRFRVGEIE